MPTRTCRTEYPKISCYLLASLLVLPVAGTVHAEEILVAVASNFALPMSKLVENFETETGHEVELAFGSSGRFYAQILNGAPYQVFLSADQEKPEQLEESGLTVNDSRFTYATGSLVLWSADEDLVTGGAEVLDGDYRRLALANPELAPYGRAATQVLEALGKLEQLRPRWVQGENIAQAYQFVETGNAELGFVALSQVIEAGDLKSGSGWRVPAELHEPIRQDAVLLRRAENCDACRQFMDYLRSDEVRRELQSFGYVNE